MLLRNGLSKSVCYFNNYFSYDITIYIIFLSLVKYEKIKYYSELDYLLVNGLCKYNSLNNNDINVISLVVKSVYISYIFNI